MRLSADRIIAKARKLEAAGEKNEAAALYESLLEEFPGNARARAALATLQRSGVARSAQKQRLPQENLTRLVSLFTKNDFNGVVVEGERLLNAFSDSPELHNILGAAHAALGQRDAAHRCYDNAIKIRPDFVIAHNNRGNLFFSEGRAHEAIDSYKEAIRIFPNFAEGHNNIGAVLKSLGRAAEAFEYYERAIRLKPDYADAYNNAGIVLDDLGRPKEALRYFSRALSINPKLVAACKSIGSLLSRQGDLDQAAAAFARALQVNPDDAEAHHGLGVTRRLQGNFQQAHAYIKKAISIDAGKQVFWKSLAGLLKVMPIERYSDELADDFLAVLERNTLIRPNELVRPIISLLRFHPDIGLDLITPGPYRSESDLREACSRLSKAPLLLRIMEICPIPDRDVEKRLREIRLGLLLRSEEVPEKDALRPFQISLALHCFTNEYVFGETAEEKTAIQSLETKLKSHSGDVDAERAYDIVCLASFRPLFIYDWAKNLEDEERFSTLFQRQYAEPAKERSLYSQIARHREITNETSTAVARLYEDNPYPRWVNTSLSAEPVTASSLAKQLRLRLVRDLSFNAPRILIAGCGTGQHALSTASRFKDATTLAVDISASSLAVAQRKTDELGVKNIVYLQADILSLRDIEDTYDIIESVGVLHHMDDPSAGWKILASRLNPGGLMKIGLYSKLARRHITRIRERIANAKVGSSYDDMTSFRRLLLEAEDEDAAKLRRANDFYSTGAVRDLLFHVCEHHFTLPQIKTSLEELGLCFSGFEFADERTFDVFQNHYSDIHDLDQWRQFEAEHPDLFAGMYHFWVQKQ